MVVDVRSTRSLVRNMSPVDPALVHLLLGEGADLGFLGEVIEDEIARAIVAGELNPRTLMPYDCVVLSDYACLSQKDEILDRDFWRVIPSYVAQSESQKTDSSAPRRQPSAAAHPHRLDVLRCRRFELQGHGLAVESLHKRRKTTDVYLAPPTNYSTEFTVPPPFEPAEMEYLPRFSSLRPQSRRDEDFWDRLLLTGNGQARDA